MNVDDRIADTTLDQRVALLGLVCHSIDGSTPVDSSAVRAACSERLTDPDGPVFGRLSEGDVMSALYRLESAGLVAEVDDEDPSPVGKGRPKYDLVVDHDRVLDELEADDRIADLVGALREDVA